MPKTHLHCGFVFRPEIRKPLATCGQRRNAQTRQSGTTSWHRAGISWFLCSFWVCWFCSSFIWGARREHLISLVKMDSRASWSCSAGRRSTPGIASRELNSRDFILLHHFGNVFLGYVMKYYYLDFFIIMSMYCILYTYKYICLTILFYAFNWLNSI